MVEHVRGHNAPRLQPQKNETTMTTYSICDSKTGETIVKSIELPADQVENLSSDTAEGHFRAGSLDELIAAGVDADRIVYALRS